MKSTGILGLVFFSAAMVWSISNQLHRAPPDIEQDASYISGLMRNSVHISMEDGSCSGWVLAGMHRVVTAAHCASGKPNEKFYVDFGDGVNHAFYIDKIGDTDMSTGPDMMTLSTNDKTVKWPAGFGPCPNGPSYGEKVMIFGSPYGMKWTATFGRVSQPNQDVTDQMSVGQNKIVRFAEHYIQIDGEMGPGNSGGPIFSESRQCVIGIADILYYRNGEPFAVKLVEPISYLANIS